MNRRNFLNKMSKLSLFAYLSINNISTKLYAQTVSDSIDSILKAKINLQFHNQRPLNAEAFAHFLNDNQTPYEEMFIRNNGLLPDPIDTDTWSLEISGESIQHKTYFSLVQLKKLFKEISLNVVLECGGNGRSEYFPSAQGNQWNTGAVACVKWSGIKLSDVLTYCGIKKDALYVGYYGKDKHLSKDTNKSAISRGCPIEKALDENTILAYKMNDKEIPFVHGYPLRLIVPGYPGSASGKWLHKIVVRNIIHDGTKMGGYAYRIPKMSVAPGTKVAKKDMKIIEEMPVKSLITSIKTGIQHKLSEPLLVEGHAWAGNGDVSSVMISKDYGITWQKAVLSQATNKNAWQRFSHTIDFNEIGYYEIWARAIDTLNRSQPIAMPGWNPKGYLNNAAHRIAVTVLS
jgi:DMSO/TMAO reductase YedYZ molybdopterin-dependent catalytic subunit